MKRILMLACGLAAIAGATSLVRAQTPVVTAIRAARLFDGTSDATIADAVVLVQGSRITGTIEAGKEADIVAVPGDVLRNIAATETVRFVMKGGTIVRHDR